MKCSNCYSRDIDDNNICKLCGSDISKFSKKESNKKIHATFAIFIFLMFFIPLLGILFFFGITQVLNKYLNGELVINRALFDNVKIYAATITGFLGAILTFVGTHRREKRQEYQGYCLGKIVDYRPINKKKYYPIIEYVVSQKKYRIVANPVKVKELEGLVGIRYKIDNPLLAMVDGEKSGDLFIILGIALVALTFSIFVI